MTLRMKLSIKTKSAIQEQWKHVILANMRKMYKSNAREVIDLLSKSQQNAVHDNGEVGPRWLVL